MCSWYCARYLRYKEKYSPVAAFKELIVHLSDVEWGDQRTQVNRPSKHRVI